MEKQFKLHDLVQEVEEKMRQLNYAAETINAYKATWSDLLKYADDKSEYTFSLKLGEDYLMERWGIDVNLPTSENTTPKWRVKGYRRHIYVLADYQNLGVILRKRRTERIEIPSGFREPAEHYMAACRKRYNSESTIKQRMFTLKSFFAFLEQNQVNDVAGINGIYISEFTKTMIGWSQRTIGSSLATIRHFLTFLYNEGYHTKDLTDSTPRVNCGRTAKLPKIWTVEEIKSILKAVDRGTPEGKRDYAILLLVTHLGIRDSDVQNLTFEQIHWKDCCIRLVQSKTGHPLELPLSEEIGNAIIDYLKYGRPKQDNTRYIFVRHKAPYGKCVRYYDIMRRYLYRAKIKLDHTKPHGLHTLRHTLATRLLAQKVPLETISEILGHKSVNSTNVYLRVDIKSLRECALNPEEVFVNE